MSAPRIVRMIGGGARTALGRSLPASAAAVRAGLSHVTEHPYLVDRLERKIKVARATWLPDHVSGAERAVALAVNAAKEALAPIARGGSSQERIHVFVGLSETRPGRPADLDEVVVDALGKGARWAGRVERVVPVAQGHAAALVAIDSALAAIRNGDSEVCLAGGVDSYFESETMEWLESTERLHGPENRWGFVPGEAAAFCLLASADWARKHRLPAPLTVLATSRSEELARIRTETICVGKGLSAVFEGALAPVRAEKDRVTGLLDDLNGEPYRADELGFALTRSADALTLPGDVMAPAQHWGDVGAASGALFAGLAFAAANRVNARAATTLMWASSEGGCRAAAVVRARSFHGEAEEA